MKSYTQWQCHELQLTAAHAPHTVDCGITAVFTAPDGKQITRNAFWNGGDTFLIRFALTQPGTWHYQITGAETPVQGAIECLPYTGTTPIYQHGFVKVGPQGRYLCHADNTPFFWLGDTHWHFAIKELWDESNDPRFESQFRAIVDKRAQQNFNVYSVTFIAKPHPRPVRKICILRGKTIHMFRNWISCKHWIKR